MIGDEDIILDVDAKGNVYAIIFSVFSQREMMIHLFGIEEW